jgi:hypothetical protein
MLLAVVTQDFMILSGMSLALAAGIWIACTTPLILVRVGALLSVGPIGLGLANFGWKPFLGGRQFPDTYFGCTMLCVGILFMALFGSLEAVRRHLALPKAQPRGFPVLIDEKPGNKQPPPPTDGMK